MSRRAALIAIAVPLIGLLHVMPAAADDPVVVGERNPDGGSVSIRIPGSTGSPGVPSTGTTAAPGSGSTTPIVCRYYKDGNPDADDLPLVDTATLETGDWVWVSCFDPGTGVPVGQAARVQWNIGAPPPLQPTAANLAQVALNRLAVPLPTVTTWPASGGTSLVNLPVWLHVGNWAQLSASASTGGLTATVTAEPVRATWNMDEDTVTCAVAGAPYNTSLSPDEQSTDCSYTYRHSSGTRTDGTFHATGTLVWHLRWSATNGQGGDLGEISRTTAFTLRVEESQALVSSAG